MDIQYFDIIGNILTGQEVLRKGLLKFPSLSFQMVKGRGLGGTVREAFANCGNVPLAGTDCKQSVSVLEGMNDSCG